VTVTLKGLRPHPRLTLKGFDHKARAGSNTIRLQKLGGHHAIDTVVVTIVHSGAGAAHTTSDSVTFIVK
jgi:hypothetical protein